MISHRGKVEISPDLVLTWLQFDGGHLLEVQLDKARNVIECIIEHPDMPEATDGISLLPLHVLYESQYDAFGRQISYTRISPMRAQT